MLKLRILPPATYKTCDKRSQCSQSKYYTKPVFDGDNLPAHFTQVATPRSIVVSCEYGVYEQIADHVLTACPIHQAPHRARGLAVLDDET